MRVSAHAAVRGYGLIKNTREVSHEMNGVVLMFLHITTLTPRVAEARTAAGRARRHSIVAFAMPLI